MGLIIGLIFYLILFYSSNWNPISLITSVVFLEVSVISGVFMRFLSGLGITLTYASFCVVLFRLLTPSLKGKKERVKWAKVLVLIPTLLIVIYSVYTIWSAMFIARPLSDFDFFSMIFGVWSLMVLVYIIPIFKGEYTPDLDDAKNEGIHEKIGEWRFSIWRGYQSTIKRNYGRVAEEEFVRYSARLFTIRAILSGLLLLPISLILFTITPLAILGIISWFRMFSLNYRYFSKLERAVLFLVTVTVAILTTISFIQIDLVGYNIFFSEAYATGLLAGLLLLSIIILRK